MQSRVTPQLFWKCKEINTAIHCYLSDTQAMKKAKTVAILDRSGLSPRLLLHMHLVGTEAPQWPLPVLPEHHWHHARNKEDSKHGFADPKWLKVLEQMFYSEALNQNSSSLDCLSSDASSLQDSINQFSFEV
jgi:hypothetical protein